MDNDEEITYRIGNDSIFELYKSNKLGSGSYSTVYLGRCLNCDSITIDRDDGFVAIKKIDTSSMSPETIKLIDAEISIMRWLIDNPHTNIVKCYDVIEDMNIVYIIMEYCDGGELSSLLVNQIPEISIRYYFSQLVSALEWLSKNNITHRDIKPRNIMLTGAKKEIKICDFGFARRSENGETSNTVCGSPLYMAPEILFKKSYNGMVDVWSLGLILYEMIYLSNPFTACKDIGELKRMIINGISIPDDGNNVSETCLNLLKMMLELDCNKRITIEDIKKHKWFTITIDNIDVQNIQAIQYKNDMTTNNSDSLMFQLDD